MSDACDSSQAKPLPRRRPGGQSGGVSIGDVRGGIHGSQIAGRDIIMGGPADQALGDELRR